MNISFVLRGVNAYPGGIHQWNYEVKAPETASVDDIAKSFKVNTKRMYGDFKGNVVVFDFGGGNHILTWVYRNEE